MPIVNAGREMCTISHTVCKLALSPGSQTSGKGGCGCTQGTYTGFLEAEFTCMTNLRFFSALWCFSSVFVCVCSTYITTFLLFPSFPASFLLYLCCNLFTWHLSSFKAWTLLSIAPWSLFMSNTTASSNAISILCHRLILIEAGFDQFIL